MAHAYTPGLRVSRMAVIRKRRLLPLKGEVLVRVGDRVRKEDIVAKTDLPGNITTVNVVNLLGVTPEEVPGYMLKREGAPVRKDEPIAETRPLIKWFKATVRSPVAGAVESISSVTGQVLLREPPQPVAVRAYMDGTVTEVFPGEGVIVQTAGTFIQGIFGVGGETWGPLHRVASSPEEPLTPERIGPEHRGRIVVAGSLATSAGIRRAIECGVKGVIAGGIHDRDLKELLGYDLGVAITGTEEIGLTIVVTEGFGGIAMAGRTFALLRECEGREASLSGATQIRAGVMRPEIIVPAEPEQGEGGWKGGSETRPYAPERGGLKVGDPVRVIRQPYFGRLGVVASLPSELQTVESETRVRVLEVRFGDGVTAVVPRANVEIIEE